LENSHYDSWPSKRGVVTLNPVEFLEQEKAELLLITKIASTLGKNNHEIFMLFLSN
jgi:hypothetical protein